MMISSSFLFFCKQQPTSRPCCNINEPKGSFKSHPRKYITGVCIFVAIILLLTHCHESGLWSSGPIATRGIIYCNNNISLYPIIYPSNILTLTPHRLLHITLDYISHLPLLITRSPETNYTHYITPTQIHTCQVLDLKIREIFQRPPRAVPPPQPSSSIPYILRQVTRKLKSPLVNHL